MIVSQLAEQYLSFLDTEERRLSHSLVDTLCMYHLGAYSFNSIDVLLGKPVSLDIEDIFEKVVVQKRGGYCFEHNKLFYEILHYLGFEVRFVLGRVLSNRDIDAPCTHRVTILHWMGEEYLVDVGFGPMSPRTPLKLEDGLQVNLGGVLYKVDKTEDDEFRISNWYNDEFYVMYTFDLARYSEADCRVGNYYSYSHPSAVFVNNLVVSLITPDRTLSLRNCSYFRITEEITDKIEIQNSVELQQFIKQDFKIIISDEEAELVYRKVKNL